jgi:hypothetical protein
MVTPERITQKYGKVYPDAWKQAQQFRQAKGSPSLSDWSDWCYLPLAASYAIISGEATRQGCPMETAAIDIGNLGAILAWRVSKGIYRFDKTLLESLWNTPIDSALPADLLFRLPEWCCYVDLEGFERAPCDGFFVYLEEDTNTRDAEIRFSMVHGESMYTFPIHIRQRGITSGIKETINIAIQHMPTSHPQIGLMHEVAASQTVLQEVAKFFEPFMSIVLYLCSANAEVHCYTDPDKKPSRPEPKKTKDGLKFFPPQKPMDYRVGSKIGAAIRRHRSTPPNDPGKMGIQPHIRRAHFHLYRIEAGRTKTELKWLAPIPVGLQDGDLIPVVRQVDKTI